MFDLCGYSERGMLNALFYDMRAGENDAERLTRIHAFLSLCRFPCQDELYPFRNARLGGGRIRIEQSFSGFGDPDTLILLEEQGEPVQWHSVFLEAKVKTAQKSMWSIREEWQRFRILRRLGQSDSNLFIQLNAKARLVRSPQLLPGVQPARVASPALGNNSVVRRAAKELASYRQSPWFLALVPDSPCNTETLFREVLCGLSAADPRCPFHQPNPGRWGFLCWSELEKFCDLPEEQARWPGVLRNFEYNRDQIYAPVAERREPTRDQLVALWQTLTPKRQALLKVLADAGGELTQEGIFANLGFLQGDYQRLRRLKSGINAACDAAGIVRILLDGVGDGNARVHAISETDPRVWAWVAELARASG